VLSAIVSRATGQTVAEYLRPRLFEPLGFAGHTWDTRPGGLQLRRNGLSLRSVDFLKWGVLHLHDGWWQGRRVLPEGWVERGHDRVGARCPRPGSWDGARFVPVEPAWCGGGPGLRLPGLARAGRQLLRLRHVRAGLRGAAPHRDAVIAITAGVPRVRHGELSELVHDLLVPAFDGPGSPSDDRALAEGAGRRR